MMVWVAHISSYSRIFSGISSSPHCTMFVLGKGNVKYLGNISKARVAQW